MQELQRLQRERANQREGQCIVYTGTRLQAVDGLKIGEHLLVAMFINGDWLEVEGAVEIWQARERGLTN